MSAAKLHRYRFATRAQWNACQLVKADHAGLRTGRGIAPFPAYATPGKRFETSGAHAPSLSVHGEASWLDDQGDLRRAGFGEDAPQILRSPFAHVSRLVAARDCLWALSNPAPTLSWYDARSLTRHVSLPFPNAVDIASDGTDGVYALLAQEGALYVARVNRAGHVDEPVKLRGLRDALAFTFLARSRRFVVLVSASPRDETNPAPVGARLCYFDENGAPGVSVNLAALRPCFGASKLSSDARETVVLAGADDHGSGRAGYLLVFDADADLLGQLPLGTADLPATGVAAGGGLVAVSSARGVVLFRASPQVPETADGVECTLLTPLLRAPEGADDRRWLRADATVDLPEGTSLELAYAATGDALLRDRLSAVLKQGTLTAQQRLSALIDEPELEHGTSEFFGSATSGSHVYSAKLFDVRQPYLWVWLTLRAAPGARLPAISELSVLYPGRTLMENLPAIYRAEEDRPGSFVRTLVGVLETTTQGLDARIGALGSHIHPATASEPWLDYVARWLGVPWDDAFSVEQKRAVISHAAELANSRGTRAGLETLLACVISGSPRRFRVTDATADFGFAIVGGTKCRGSQLPAMLAGTRSRAELGTRAVLGHVRLPCSDDSEDDAARLRGLIRIEVAASGKERLAWQPWLSSIIAEMLPLGARLELHWVSSQALRGDRLGGALTLSSAPLTLLDSAAVLGLARLPETDTPLSSAGPTLSTRLR